MVNKKKRDRPDVEEVIARPWCYYCERDFDDQKVLISHQKAKHFKCEKCNRRLNTAGGLQVHLQQVHKETLTVVDNAIEGRQGVEPEVFGMMGIPDELLDAHRQRILNEFFKQEADRRALTGNPPPGQKNGEPNAKKRKMETPEELKARLAEHRAKRAAERLAENEGKASTSNTPDPTQGNAASGANEFMPQPQTPYDHMQPPLPQFHPPHPGLPLQSPLGAGFPPPFPVQQPGQWPSHMPPPSFSPPQAAPYATPPFMPPVHSPMTAHMPNVVMPSHNTRYSPTVERPPVALQPAPGLPARPSFDLPSFNRDDMQRMHTGQAPPTGNTVGRSRPAPTYPRNTIAMQTADEIEEILKLAKDEFKKEQALNASNDTQDATKESANPTSTDQNVAVDASAASTAPAATTDGSVKDKKKKQHRPMVLLYKQNHDSPEENRAKRSKYAFKRNDGPEFVEGEIGGAVTGVTVDEDTVLDVQD